jgi:hypothetical protein
MFTEIDKIIVEVNENMQQRLPFNKRQKDTIERVLKEVPEEISRIGTEFSEYGIYDMVKSENDFLLGVMISFIYYKFLMYCAFEGNAIRTEHIPTFQSSLVSNASKLLELTSKSLGK